MPGGGGIIPLGGGGIAYGKPPGGDGIAAIPEV